MSKKTTRKTSKPLPSALTVASPVEASPVAPPRALRPAVTPAAASQRPAPPLSAAKGPEQAAVAEPAHRPTPPQGASATFALFEPHATKVCLSGEFNAWSTTATPMTQQSEGFWKASLTLPPGRYQYKFVVDGQWMPDPKARESVFNEHGSLNSVIEV